MSSCTIQHCQHLFYRYNYIRIRFWPRQSAMAHRGGFHNAIVPRAGPSNSPATAQNARTIIVSGNAWRGLCVSRASFALLESAYGVDIVLPPAAQVNVNQVIHSRQSYVNSFLIQSRGTTHPSGPCTRCRDRKSTRLNSSHSGESRMPSSA